jgi:hypothetical protein
MIGVIANSSQHTVVREFFELFKTPWEFYRRNQQYEVLLVTEERNFDKDAAQLVVIYAGKKLLFDYEENIATTSPKSGCVLAYRATRLPIYGDSISFQQDGASNLVDRESGRSAIHLQQIPGSTVARIGYDLFVEITTLLTDGQPTANAGTPALDLHIALLRELIVSNGIQLIEIPPTPHGYQFIACLTHDVDHPSIRHHKFDHTMFGFLYRAVLGSMFEVFRGKMAWRNLLANWSAALRLPFVYLGIAKDFWYEFHSYTSLERGFRSSFFVIPFKGCSGQTKQGRAPNRRSCCYGAAEIVDRIQKLISVGCEVGLHGIDAWIDTSSARNELEEIRRTTRRRDIGVRMHWLYMDEHSAQRLDGAGVDYDSTVGYNETVGYRAGTTQAYKPLGAVRLLELPLHIMDTALFFPTHLDLSLREAQSRVRTIIDNAVRFGGSVVVNWHDRSIAPERCWGDFYRGLVEELERNGAWFATAAETVAWFRKRRSVSFNGVDAEFAPLQFKNTVDKDQLPAVSLRVHNQQASHPDSTIVERAIG